MESGSASSDPHPCFVANQLPRACEPRISPSATRFAGPPMQPNPTLGFKGVHAFLSGLFDGDLHAKRVLSLANASLGVIRSGSLAVHTIGLGLAQAPRLEDETCGQAGRPAAVQRGD